MYIGIAPYNQDESFIRLRVYNSFSGTCPIYNDSSMGEAWQQVECPDSISGCPSDDYFINDLYKCKYCLEYIKCYYNK